MVGNNKLLYPFFMCFGIRCVMGQSLDVKGQILANDDVEGIHILNNTSKTFTISNSKGEFSIPAKLKDTLSFSGVSYELKKVIVNHNMIHSKVLTIYLTEKINALDEVVVGKILTGHLNLDLANSGVKRDINFYDLGILGYTGQPKSQSERRLYTAGDFKPIHLLALLGGSLPLDPIFNAISGRTKLLKNKVHLESQDECILKTKANLSEVLFSAYSLEAHYKTEFFYFCADDSQYNTLCINNDDFKTFEFLKEKMVSFKANLQTKLQE